ncbi:MAG: methyl-accepting chemotaxis protein [Planctomycetaceae bacterium]|nr:methyl-accepting chemotaxis protein [Planctomycetaceae bacterium]
MHTFLDIKWRVIAAVVGVSLLSLVITIFVTRKQTEGFILDKSRDLFREMTVIEADGYSTAFMESASLMRSLISRVQSELSIGDSDHAPANLTRLSSYVGSVLDSANITVRGYGVVLKPGVYPVTAEDDPVNVNADGNVSIVYTRKGGVLGQTPPMTPRELRESGWWQRASEEGITTWDEPYMVLADNPGGNPIPRSVFMVAQPLTYGDEIIGAVYLRFCVTRYQEVTAAKRQASGQISKLNAMFVSPEGACIGVPQGMDLSDLVIQSPDPSLIPHLKPGAHPELASAVAASRVFSGTILLGRDQQPTFVVSRPVSHDLPVQYWSVVAFLPEADLYAEAQRAMAGQLPVFAGLLLLALLFGYFIARLTGKSLVQNEDWYRAILDRVPLPLGIVGKDNAWGYVNSTLKRLFTNRGREEFVGATVEETLFPDEAAFCRRSNQESVPEIITEDFVQDNGAAYSITSCRLLDSTNTYLGRLVIGIDTTNARNIALTLQDAQNTALALDANSDDIYSASQEMSASTMQITAAIEEITVTAQDMGEMSAEYSKSAERSHQMAAMTRETSGSSAVEAEGAAEAMRKVRDSGEKVASVIRLIDEIAFQTNLLALNAAVESARAGRHGRGFAVVADEVRRLAQRSAKAAGETSTMITEMTERIGDAATSIEMLAERLKGISEGADMLTRNSDEVARLADNLTQGVRQVHASLNQITENLQSATVVSRRVSDIAGVIQNQSTQLRGLTQRRGRKQLRIGKS